VHVLRSSAGDHCFDIFLAVPVVLRPCGVSEGRINYNNIKPEKIIISVIDDTIYIYMYVYISEKKKRERKKMADNASIMYLMHWHRPAFVAQEAEFPNTVPNRV
jgi:hypothetical protein